MIRPFQKLNRLNAIKKTKPQELQVLGVFREGRRIRTFDRLLRRQVLYPAELCLHEFNLSGWQDSNLRPPAPKAGAITGLRYTPKILRRVRDSNPWYSFPYACLANMSFRPLRQLSKKITV